MWLLDVLYDMFRVHCLENMQAYGGFGLGDTAARMSTPLGKLVRSLHTQVPRNFRLAYQGNVRQTLSEVSSGGVMRSGSGCTGTNIAHHAWQSLLDFWDETLNTGVNFISDEVAAEIDEAKQSFLQAQFAINCLVADVAELENPKVRDARGGLVRSLPESRVFGGGFSCASVCNQNNNRHENVGCVRDVQGTTGQTFHSIAVYIHKMRPRVSFLENVVTLNAKYEFDSLSTSDVEYILEWFTSRNFTIVHVEVSARERGAKKELIRLWFVIWDIPPFAAEILDVQANFWSVMNSLRRSGEEDPPVESYFVEEDVLRALVEHLPQGLDAPPAKRTQQSYKWKGTHEMLFSEARLDWPPDISHLGSFREREGELVVLADFLFPAQQEGWDLFDSSHSAERIFQTTATEKDTRANPWRRHVTTLTGQSSMCCRYTSAKGTEVLRRLHPIEGFRFNLWDAPHWRVGPYTGNGVDTEVLNDMVGNSWSLHHVVPLTMAAFGAVDWRKIPQLIRSAKEKHVEDTLAVAVASSSADSESD